MEQEKATQNPSSGKPLKTIATYLIVLLVLFAAMVDTGSLTAAYLFFLLLCIPVYFLPAIVALRRDHPNKLPILLINVFAGATGIGWLVALVWSVIAIPDEVKAPLQSSADVKKEPQQALPASINSEALSNQVTVPDSNPESTSPGLIQKIVGKEASQDNSSEMTGPVSSGKQAPQKPYNVRIAKKQNPNNRKNLAMLLAGITFSILIFVAALNFLFPIPEFKVGTAPIYSDSNPEAVPVTRTTQTSKPSAKIDEPKLNSYPYQIMEVQNTSYATTKRAVYRVYLHTSETPSSDRMELTATEIWKNNKQGWDELIVFMIFGRITDFSSGAYGIANFGRTGLTKFSINDAPLMDLKAGYTFPANITIKEIPAEWKIRDNSTEASVMIKDLVRQKLVAPSTAKFPGALEMRSHVKHIGEGRYFVKSWVDSQNRFGAMVRTLYEAEIAQKGPGLSSRDWELVSFKEVG